MKECYLKARQEINTFTEDGLGRAIQHLNNGLAIVGENELLYAGMGYAYWQYANLGVERKDSLKKIEEYAQKAEFPKQIIQGLAEIGAFGPYIPAEYGGAGLDQISYGLIMQEIDNLHHRYRTYA